MNAQTRKTMRRRTWDDRLVNQGEIRIVRLGLEVEITDREEGGIQFRTKDGWLELELSGRNKFTLRQRCDG